MMPSNKKFGYFFAIISMLFGLYFFWYVNDSLAIISFFISLAFILFAFFAPNILAPFNRLWFRLGILLGKFFNPLVLGAVFFILIVPISIAMRFYGRDILLLKKRQVLSYWIEKDLSDPTSFENQF
jgi:hypothetical protein